MSLLRVNLTSQYPNVIMQNNLLLFIKVILQSLRCQHYSTSFTACQEMKPRYMQQMNFTTEVGSITKNFGCGLRGFPTLNLLLRLTHMRGHLMLLLILTPGIHLLRRILSFIMNMLRKDQLYIPSRISKWLVNSKVLG
uniref:Uncharacterized protein n=1 Tax=Opuntia streptacantha TaxID=393608 RepID=A0A7C9FKZ5_OPUST